MKNKKKKKKKKKQKDRGGGGWGRGRGTKEVETSSGTLLRDFRQQPRHRDIDDILALFYTPPRIRYILYTKDISQDVSTPHVPGVRGQDEVIIHPSQRARFRPWKRQGRGVKSLCVCTYTYACAIWNRIRDRRFPRYRHCYHSRICNMIYRRYIGSR